MHYDDYNSSKSRGSVAQSGGRQSAQPHQQHRPTSTTHYESDEDSYGDDRRATTTSANRGHALASHSSSQQAHASNSIISSSNDPSLMPIDQVTGGALNDDSPMFQLERLDWKPSKEQGAIIGLAAANNILLIATQNSTLIRWNHDTDGFEIISLSKRLDDRVHKIFLDPTGHHSIASMTNGQVYYSNSQWGEKAHLLSKVKGILIESIAWNHSLGTESSTKKILIGTNRGLIYETCIEEKDKYFKKVHDLCLDDMSGSSSGPSSAAGGRGDGAILASDLITTTPVSGLHMELFPSSADAGEANYKWFVMAATPNRQFQFIGGPTFEALFARYTGNVPNSFRDFPGDLTYSELRTFAKYSGRGKSATADSVAWMNGVGIYSGGLVFNTQDKGQDVLQNGKLLAYPSQPDGSRSIPVSLALTEFHFILAMKNRLISINQLSEDIVYEEVFNTSTFGEMQGLAMDARKDTVWLYSDKFVFAVEIIKEDRDAWKLYLAQGEFELAMEYCDTDAQIERVTIARADHTFEKGLFQEAAKIYAETSRSFEEVALKFVNISSGVPVPNATSPSTADPNSIASKAAAALGSLSSGASPLSLTRLSTAQQSEARSALKAYLLAKLVTLDPTELTQQVMICTWLTEIFLDNINRLQEGTLQSAASLLRKRGRAASNKGVNSQFVATTSPFPDVDEFDSEGGVGDDDGDDEDLVLQAEERAQAREDEVREFRSFLVEYFDCLNKETTFDLISSHGRIHELLFYAETIGDWEWVLNYHVQQGNYFQALDILQDHEHPSKIADKFYKFTPILMYYLPKQTVDMLCNLGKTLDPSKLIPALMRYNEGKKEEKEKEKTKSGNGKTNGREQKDAEEDDDAAGPNHAIRYLEHMILKLKNRDPVIHNYLIALYAKDRNEARLVQFITSSRNRICFDYKYALRVCHEEHQYRACVAIYEVMHFYEEATRMALELDLELAKSVVMRAQDPQQQQSSHLVDEHQRKRLWILIARHVIEHEQDISKAMKILKECEVRLEEILPFFPDFVKIGEFKEEICKSLDTYNNKIELLKNEMEEYTESANLIRNDINALRSRSCQISSNQKCDLCSLPVLTRQFLLFPCTHAFHTSCCVAEATKYLSAHPQRKEQVLEEFKDPFAASSSSSSSSSASSMKASERELRSIENFASCECCLCGEIMIDSVAAPFIDMGTEEADAKAWDI